MWFDTPSSWIMRFKIELQGNELSYYRMKIAEAHSIIIFHKRHEVSNGNYVTIQNSDIYKTSPKSLFQYPLKQFEELRKFQKHIFCVNGIFPKELCPRGLYPQHQEKTCLMILWQETMFNTWTTVEPILPYMVQNPLLVAFTTTYPTS